MPSSRTVFLVPPAPVVLAALVFLVALIGREASISEDLPFFLSPDTNYLHVELVGPGFPAGVYQLNDALPILDVIKLTVPEDELISSSTEDHFEPVHNGASYLITKKDQKIEIVQQGWMSASQRIAMGIPLHPDRMSRSDWVALPGIGKKLAERIDLYRQKNGDFGSLDKLKKVNGVGPGRIEAWRTFFDGS